MELASLKQQIPSCCCSAIRPSKIPGKDEQTCGIEESQDCSDQELSVLKPDDSNDGLRKSG